MSIKLTPIDTHDEIVLKLAESLRKSLEAPMPQGWQPGNASDFDVKFTLSKRYDAHVPKYQICGV
jgi:hypothetical protein